MPTATRLSSPVSPTEDPLWRLVEEGFDLAREREIESLFTAANGYTGTRARWKKVASSPRRQPSLQGASTGVPIPDPSASSSSRRTGRGFAARSMGRTFMTLPSSTGECLTCARGSFGASGRAATRADALPASGVFVWRRWPIVTCSSSRSRSHRRTTVRIWSSRAGSSGPSRADRSTAAPPILVPVTLPGEDSAPGPRANVLVFPHARGAGRSTIRSCSGPARWAREPVTRPPTFRW